MFPTLQQIQFNGPLASNSTRTIIENNAHPQQGTDLKPWRLTHRKTALLSGFSVIEEGYKKYL